MDILRVYLKSNFLASAALVWPWKGELLVIDSIVVVVVVVVVVIVVIVVVVVVLVVHGSIDNVYLP